MRSEPDADSLQRLRETLAHLFPSAADTQMVLRDIDLAPERVDDTGSAEVRWFHAVAETVKQGRLHALVARARETYRDNEALVAGAGAAAIPPVLRRKR
jgi:hypothetical protein